jgi:hypothetical protein
MVTKKPSDAESSPKDERTNSAIDEEAVKRLAQAIARLNNDPEWFLGALTEHVKSLRPVTRKRLTREQKRYLISVGEFTVRSLAETEKHVDRGSLQLDSVESWLSYVNDTISIDDAASLLKMDVAELPRAVAEGSLFATEVAGRLRFPKWQFDVSQPGRVLPGLEEVIAAAKKRWDARGVSAFMATPQSGLVSSGRKTPVAWLRDGGDVEEVVAVIEAGDWW